ncbi:MAG: FmdB family zinc ribbon protein [Acidimicrobiales bacterium]
MPTYEYRCEHCDQNFDVVQSFHDNPLQTCPTCGSPVRKVFGNVGIVFKGSGFYKNDSRDKKVRAGAEKGDGASTGAPENSGKPASAAGENGAASSSNGSAPADGGATAGAPSSDKSDKKPATASKASSAKEE